MDKNTIIGFLLIGAVIFAFSWFNRPTPEQIEAQKRYNDSIQAVEIAKQAEIITRPNPSVEEEALLPVESDSLQNDRLYQRYGDFYEGAKGEEAFFVLENEVLEVTLSNKGGQIASVRLKDFQTHDSLPLMLFNKKESDFNFALITQNNRVINTKQMYFEPIRSGDNTLSFRLSAGQGRSLTFTYSLQPNSYMVDFKAAGNRLDEVLSLNSTGLDMEWQQVIRQQEKGRKFEDRYAWTSYKFMTGDIERTSDSKDEQVTVSGRVHWVGYKDQFFSSVLISDKVPMESVAIDQKISQKENILKNCRTTAVLPFDVKEGESIELAYFFGPNKYTLLKGFDDSRESGNELQLNRLISLGASVFRWINVWVVIPLFDFLGKFFGSFGFIIFILTLVIKTVLFPLTYKSYMSSAKMRVLKPQVEELNKKYPGQEKAMERQKATMELYNKAGASPMSGCLPMLLQMPVWLALFNFFPSSIELRQQSFLWAKDLSTYDAIFSWNVHIPLISTYFGNHISLFCLLMAITNMVYTQFNMAQTNTGQQQMPGMKLMMYFFPIMMLVLFNQYPSALSYYFFISTLITIIQTLICRWVVNEEKLLAKLEANKKKPKKKSGFMARLEEAQRRQMEEARKQQKQGKRR